MTKPEGPV